LRLAMFEASVKFASPKTMKTEPHFVSHPMIKNWIFLLTAIISEVIATSALKSSDGFSRLWPSVLVVLGYGIAFYCLALSLKVIPMGVAYGIWSGIGIVLITLVGWLLFDQKLDLPALLGIALIASGVIVMNVFSKTLGH